MATMIFSTPRLATRFAASVAPTLTTARRSVLDVLNAFAEARMLRAQVEIERYRRLHPDPDSVEARKRSIARDQGFYRKLNAYCRAHNRSPICEDDWKTAAYSQDR